MCMANAQNMGFKKAQITMQTHLLRQNQMFPMSKAEMLYVQYCLLKYMVLCLKKGTLTS